MLSKKSLEMSYGNEVEYLIIAFKLRFNLNV